MTRRRDNKRNVAGFLRCSAAPDAAYSHFHVFALRVLMPAFCEMQKPINGFKVGDLLRGIQSSGLSSKCVPSHCLASSTVAIAHVAVSPFGQVLLPPWLSHHPSLHSRRVLDPQCWPPFHFKPSSRRSSGSPPIHEITMHLRSSKCQWPPAIIGSARSAAFSRPSAVQSQLVFSDHFCVHSWSRAKIQDFSSHSSSARFKRILSSIQATEIQLVYI